MPHSAVSARELKFGKNFDLIDADHDGIITVGDWHEFASYMCSQFREPIESSIASQVREAVLGWWYMILGWTEGPDDRQLTRVAFTAFYVDCTDENLGAVIDQYVDAVFALCDGDADGRLSRREFAGVLRVHGVPEHELTQTMQHIVADDGDISKERYTALVIDFCLSTDTQAPGSWLLGRV